MKVSKLIAALVLLGCLLPASESAPRMLPRAPFKHAFRYGNAVSENEVQRSSDLINQCELRHRKTRLDHFTWARQNATFPMRYFVCDRHYRPGGSMFFYLGNEADVTLYLNNTGLMWELAPRHDALLVFAEHRYYGESLPFPADQLRQNMAFLTSEQAMADFAALIWELKEELDPQLPVIGFGGSYGGMLATWFRMKYPHLLDGAIAGSAPIWTYLGEDPPYDSGSFAATVTRDASPAGGSAPACAPNAKAAWKTLFDWGGDREGRAAVARAMRLCGGADALDSGDDVEALALWAQNAWDFLAMGDYPYASTYILNGAGTLPAYPVRVACEKLSEEGLHGEALLSAMADAVGVFYNFTGGLECFDFNASANNETEIDADFWGYQFCTEQFQPFSRDGEADMFWPQPFDAREGITACQGQWGVRPQPLKPTIEWGGRRIAATSNIVFSNGGLDPWSGGGVLSSLSDTLVAVLIPEGAHHLDLMFSNPLDPPSVVAARRLEEEHIGRWIREARGAAPSRAAAGAGMAGAALKAGAGCSTLQLGAVIQ